MFSLLMILKQQYNISRKKMLIILKTSDLLTHKFCMIIRMYIEYENFIISTIFFVFINKPTQLIITHNTTHYFFIKLQVLYCKIKTLIKNVSHLYVAVLWYFAI